jgi:hypothetical protein
LGARPIERPRPGRALQLCDNGERRDRHRLLYVALFALILGGAELVVTPHVLASDRPRCELADYATLARFVASLATIGGALGAALESNEAILEAAYSSISQKELAIDEHFQLNAPPSLEQGPRWLGASWPYREVLLAMSLRAVSTGANTGAHRMAK